MASDRLQYDLETTNFRDAASVGYFDVGSKGKMLGFGTTVPADATVGWSPGALFIQTDGATRNTVIYCNIGTRASSNFNNITVNADTDFGVGGMQAMDDAMFVFGTGEDAGFIFSTGDADNNALVLFVDDASQALHITDKGARASDWNISAGTHPTVYIHSNTTPITDYLRIGDHDGTEADIDCVGGTSIALKLAGTEYASVRVTGLACGTYVVAATAGTDQLTLKSTGTAPASTGANVGHLYADFETDDDELFWLSGTNGTATQLTT